MKLCRFQAAGKTAVYGLLKEEKVFRLANQNIFAEDFTVSGESYRLSEIELRQFIEPSKIVCVGRNYAAHAKELGNEVPSEPLLFLKAPTSLIVDGAAIVLPPQSSRVEHEGELALIVRRAAKNISADENPLDYVLGYACLNDVTARDLQKKDVQFTRAKSFDTFCPLGVWIETELDPDNLEIATRVNNEVRQSGSTSQMIFSTAELIRYISRQMTLLPGDVIATGTPSGVAPLVSGDVCEVEIENIGVLRNPVIDFQ